MQRLVDLFDEGWMVDCNWLLKDWMVGIIDWTIYFTIIFGEEIGTKRESQTPQQKKPQTSSSPTVNISQMYECILCVNFFIIQQKGRPLKNYKDLLTLLTIQPHYILLLASYTGHSITTRHTKRHKRNLRTYVSEMEDISEHLTPIMHWRIMREFHSTRK